MVNPWKGQHLLSMQRAGHQQGVRKALNDVSSTAIIEHVFDAQLPDIAKAAVRKKGRERWHWNNSCFAYAHALEAPLLLHQPQQRIQVDFKRSSSFPLHTQSGECASMAVEECAGDQGQAPTSPAKHCG